MDKEIRDMWFALGFLSLFAMLFWHDENSLAFIWIFLLISICKLY